MFFSNIFGVEDFHLKLSALLLFVPFTYVNSGEHKFRAALDTYGSLLLNRIIVTLLASAVLKLLLDFFVKFVDTR